MLRPLMAIAALSTMLSTAVLAQDNPPPANSTMPMTTDNMATDSMTQRTPLDMSAGYAVVDTDNLATKIIGSSVYSSAAKDAEKIGDINDLILTGDGKVGAVVIGVGGFLGLGEKQVAVDFSTLQWVVAADNTERFVLETTKDALTAAPDFQWRDDKPVDGTAPADGTMAPAPAPSN